MEIKKKVADEGRDHVFSDVNFHFLEVGIYHATSRSDRPLEQADSIVLPNISLGCIAGKIHWDNSPRAAWRIFRQNVITWLDVNCICKLEKWRQCYSCFLFRMCLPSRMLRWSKSYAMICINQDHKNKKLHPDKKRDFRASKFGNKVSYNFQ